eukprot:tig00020704_g13217.t2
MSLADEFWFLFPNPVEVPNSQAIDRVACFIAVEEIRRAQEEARRAEQRALASEDDNRRAREEARRAEQRALASEEEIRRAQEEARRAEQRALTSEEDAQRAREEAAAATAAAAAAGRAGALGRQAVAQWEGLEARGVHAPGPEGGGGGDGVEHEVNGAGEHLSLGSTPPTPALLNISHPLSASLSRPSKSCLMKRPVWACMRILKQHQILQRPAVLRISLFQRMPMPAPALRSHKTGLGRPWGEAELAAAAERLKAALARVEELRIAARAAALNRFECPVCLHEKERGERRLLHPCGHVVCAACVQRLAGGAGTCPIWREPFGGHGRRQQQTEVEPGGGVLDLSGSRGRTDGAAAGDRRLASLKELVVNENQLTALPPEIGRLAALQCLSAANNRLTALPPEIGRLAALKELYVHGNPVVDSWPEHIRRAVNEGAPNNGAAQCAVVVPYLRSLLAPTPAAAPVPGAPPVPNPPAGPPVRTSAPAPSRRRGPFGPRVIHRRGACCCCCYLARPRRGGAGPAGMRVADVCEWLRSVELGDLAPAFERHRVDGKMLLALADADLQRELGVESGLVRKKLLVEIAELAKESGAQSAASRRVPPLPPGYEFHAFITYRRLDGRNHLAAFVREALDKAGYKVFFDLETLQGGVFDSKILESLRASCCDVFVLTPGTLKRCFEDKAPSAALSTDWVRKEVVESLRLGKAIVPFVDDPNERFPSCDGLPADMAAFSRHNAVFFSNMYQQAAIAKLCALIDAAVAAAAPFEELPAPLA